MEHMLTGFKYIAAFILICFAVYIFLRIVTVAIFKTWDEVKEKQWKRETFYSKVMEDYDEKVKEEGKQKEQSPFKTSVPVGSSKEENGDKPQSCNGRTT